MGENTLTQTLANRKKTSGSMLRFVIRCMRSVSYRMSIMLRFPSEPYSEGTSEALAHL